MSETAEDVLFIEKDPTNPSSRATKVKQYARQLLTGEVKEGLSPNKTDSATGDKYIGIENYSIHVLIF